MSSAHLEIDTKGICLLCLSEYDKESRPPTRKGSSIAFTSLLRYLKIETSEFLRTLKQFGNGDEDEARAGEADLVVSLCPQCSAVTSQFFQLFLDFEKIRMGMDRCCKKLHALIEEGAMDFQRVTEFQRRMMTLIPTRGWEISEDGKIAEMLRKKTMEQCATRLHQIIPPTTSTQAIFHAAKKPRLSTATATNPTSLAPSSDSIESFNRVVVDDIRSNSSTFSRSSSSLGIGMTELVDSRDEHLDDHVKVSIPKELDLNPIEVQRSGPGCTVEVTKIPENRVEWQGTRDSSSADKLINFDGGTKNNSSSSLVLDRDTEQSFSRKFECVHCRKWFTRKYGLTEHLCNVHPMETFRDRIPDGTTKDNFVAAVESILQGRRRMENNYCACAFCCKVFRDKTQLKTHTLQNHFDKVHYRLLQDYGVPFPFGVEDGRDEQLMGSCMAVQVTTNQQGWIEEDKEPPVINLCPDEETINEGSDVIVDCGGMEKDPLDMG